MKLSSDLVVTKQDGTDRSVATFQQLEIESGADCHMPSPARYLPPFCLAKYPKAVWIAIMFVSRSERSPFDSARVTLLIIHGYIPLLSNASCPMRARQFGPKDGSGLNGSCLIP